MAVEPARRTPGQPRRIAIAANLEAAGGVLLATVGVLSLLLRGDLPGFVMPVIAGAVFLALAPGLYFHNGVARFLAPPLAVPMAFVALIVMTGDDPAGSLVGLAVLSASVVVIVAVATTADRSSLLSS